MRNVAAETGKAVVIEASTTVQDASTAMLDGEAEAIVVDADGICGLVSAEGVAQALAEGHDVTTTLAGAIADRGVPVVRADEPLAEVHQRMRTAQQPVAVVVDRYRHPIGLLTDREAAP